MYRYTPPKSNIWGHSLRNMDPVRQRELFAEFLKRAVAKYIFEQGNFTILVGRATPEHIQRFEQLLGRPAQNGAFYSLPPQQCETVLDEIIRKRDLLPGVMLLQPVEISQWLINGQPADTSSQMMLYYGMKPCISTFLQFETTDQFQFIKQVLSDLHFCTLNEKHLKPIKRGLKKSIREN